MRVLAAAGYTWGISGPMFLGLYAALAVVVVIITMLVRRALARSPVPAHPLRLDHPDDVAYLHNGPGLTVLAALSALRVAGRITLSGRQRVQAVGAVGSDAGDLQRAIHRCAQDPLPRAKLADAPPVAAVLGDIERRLIDAGLLLTTTQRSRIRATAWMLWAVVAIGVIRAIAGYQAGQPIGWLLALLAAVTVVAVGAAVLTATAPRRTDRGDAELSRLRTRHASLSPKLRPRWQVYGHEDAALGVAVFGASALWTADPAMAKELGAPQTSLITNSGGGGGGGGGCGGGGGGGGGCGGGGGGG